jgi:hypothetical protein
MIYETNILRSRSDDSFVSYVSTDESTDKSTKEGNETEETAESPRMFSLRKRRALRITDFVLRIKARNKILF